MWDNTRLLLDYLDLVFLVGASGILVGWKGHWGFGQRSGWWILGGSECLYMPSVYTLANIISYSL